jgi:hypothetical protein
MAQDCLTAVVEEQPQGDGEVGEGRQPGQGCVAQAKHIATKEREALHCYNVVKVGGGRGR